MLSSLQEEPILRIETFLQHLEQKGITLSDISLPRMDNNMSIAMLNMTESQKRLAMSKHSKSLVLNQITKVKYLDCTYT